MKDLSVNFVVGDINVLGGVERVTQTLAREFQNRKAKVTIHSIYSKSCSFLNQEEFNVVNYALPLPDREFGLFNKIKRIILNGLTLRAKLLSIDGYCIFQGFYMATYLPFLRTRWDKRIVCEHNAYDAPSKTSRIFRRLLYRYFQPQLVVLTKADEQHFQANGINRVLKIFNPSPFHPKIANEIQGSKSLISLGRFTPQKRFDYMIEICAPLLKSFPGWKLKIQGEGEDSEKIKNSIILAGLEKQVTLIPPGNPTPLYQQGSIFLMTSIYEGLPMTLIESMNFGIPAVVINCSSGLSEIIHNGQNGFLTPMGHPESFVEKVRELMDNETLRQEMGNYARTYSEIFDVTKVLNEWEKILK